MFMARSLRADVRPGCVAELFSIIPYPRASYQKEDGKPMKFVANVGVGEQKRRKIISLGA